MGRLMPWMIVTEELLNAMPASVAAMDICVRAPTLPGSVMHVARFAKMRLAAESENVRERGWAFLEVNDSMAWHSASMPVAAVTFAGAVSVNTGSTMASSGMSGVPAMSIFTSLAVSVMIVNCVASEPVPAVVGMATIGQTGPV